MIKLSMADAKVALDVMDQVSFTCSAKTVTHVASSTQVFKDDKIPREHKCDTIYTMRKLAYSSGQVPASYQIDRGSLNMEMAVIACGAFADVRKGKLGERAVAIRTLRVDQQLDKSESEKVRGASIDCSEAIDERHPRSVAFLQGVYHLDEPFSSKHLETHWR